MAMPVITGQKTDAERFAGALRTYSCEAMMQDNKALQAGTSHNLGQNFAKAFDLKFQAEHGGQEFAWNTSWGVSTRLIGGLVMTHGDDNGLRIPPLLAPIELVIVPIYKTDEERDRVLEAADRIVRRARRLGASRSRPLRVHVDDRDGMKPGAKYYEWELRGIPLRLELGPRDLDKQSGRARPPRHAREEARCRSTRIGEDVNELLMRIQEDMLIAARERREQNSIRQRISYDDFRELMDGDGAFVYAGWCGSPECEAQIKEETKATIRVLPDEEFRSAEAPTTCLKCGRAVDRRGGMGQSVLTTGFSRVDGQLHCEGVSLERIARDVGTPVYVYSAATIRDRYARLDRTLAPVPHRIHYTLKANSSLGVLDVLRALGAGVDVVSGGELHRALRAGLRAVGHHFRRRRQDGARARRGARRRTFCCINVESEAEVRIDRPAGARARHRGARLASRESRDHARDAARLHQDGRQGTQVRHSVRRRRARRATVAAGLPHVELVGLDMHLGSQLSRIDPYREGTERLASIFAELHEARHRRRSSTSTSAAASACATTPRSRPTSGASPSSCCRRSPRRGSS